MKQFIFALTSLACLSISLWGQPAAQWQKTLNILGQDEAYKIIVLPDGSMVVAGSADTDGFIMKLDANGNQLWLYTYGGDDWDEFRGITRKQDGSGFILVGFTRSYSSSGDNDVWIVETDNNGILLNQWNYGRASMYDNAYDIRPTSDGGYIIFGDSQKSVQDDWDVYLLKLDANLNLTWSSTIGTSIRERGYAGVEMIDGGYMIVGECGSPFQQDDLYILKTDSNGNKVWERTYGGEYDEEGYDIQITPDRNYIISGQSWSWGTHNGYADMYLMKVDSSGAALWPGTVSTFGGDGGEDDSGHGVMVTADNEYLEVGNTQKFTSSFTAWLVKAATDGSLKWETYYEAGGETLFNTIDLAAQNRLVMAGYAGSDVFIVKTETDTSILNNNPQAEPDTFTVAHNVSSTLAVLNNDTDPDGDDLTILWVTTPGVQGTVEIASDHKSIIYTPSANFEGVEQFTYTTGDNRNGMDKCRVVVNVSSTARIEKIYLPASAVLIKAYPNPFNLRTTLTFTLPTPGKTVLEIYNANGKRIVTLANQPFAAGTHTAYWNGTDQNGIVIPSGLYFVRLISGKKQACSKILLIK